jgi:ANTAR domain-containing protein
MTGSALAGLSLAGRPVAPPWVAGSVAVVDPGSGDSTWLDTGPFEALRLESRAIRLLSEEARARARATRHQVRRGRSRRVVPGDSAFARLQARMGTMPVIEQAKGIVMAQQGCGPEEAFDLLRRASQRTNVKLHVLAEQLVEQVASSSSASNVTPSRWAPRSLGNRQRGRAMTRSARFRRGVASRS